MRLAGSASLIGVNFSVASNKCYRTNFKQLPQIGLGGLPLEVPEPTVPWQCAPIATIGATGKRPPLRMAEGHDGRCPRLSAFVRSKDDLPPRRYSFKYTAKSLITPHTNHRNYWRLLMRRRLWRFKIDV